MALHPARTRSNMYIQSPLSKVLFIVECPQLMKVLIGRRHKSESPLIQIPQRLHSIGRWSGQQGLPIKLSRELSPCSQFLHEPESTPQIGPPPANNQQCRRRSISKS